MSAELDLLNQTIYLRAEAVRKRIGNCSAAWIRRRIRDAGFPAPVHYGTIERFWRLDKIEAWEGAKTGAEVQS